MSTTEPIRNTADLQKLKNYYLNTHYNYRNYVLIVVGLNTALRISDILQLTWEMIFDENKQEFRSHITVREQKTGKENRIFLNQDTRRILEEYYYSQRMHNSPYVFYSFKNKDKPLSRYQAYRIIRSAALKVGLEGHISCHSLRKTFGYHAWKQGIPPALLMNIYNHSSFQITQRYLCIEQDDKDEVFSRIIL